jgi:putative Holliday junction resolvase
MSRILAVDPGDARIGIAVSDPSATIARPLETLHHHSRARDAEQILELATQLDAMMILVGVPFNDDGEAGPQARKALRLVEALREISPIPITIWDESCSTQSALERGGPDPALDARAAAFILQEYLDAQST